MDIDQFLSLVAVMACCGFIFGCIFGYAVLCYRSWKSDREAVKDSFTLEKVLLPHIIGRSQIGYQDRSVIENESVLKETHPPLNA